MFFYPKHNRTASFLASAALCELFPGITLLDRGLSATGFFISFHAAYSLPSEAPILIEDKMRSIIKEKRELSFCEMVPLCAEEFLKSLGLFLRDVDEENELIEIARLGSFADRNEGSFCDTIQDLSAFKIFSVEQVEGKEFILKGVSFPTKDLLRDFLKLQKHYSEFSHFEIGLKAGYWFLVEKELIWKSSGMQAFDAFCRQVEALFLEGVEIFRVDRSEVIGSLKKKYSLFAQKIFDGSCSAWCDETGLFKSSFGHRLELYFSENDGKIAEKLISSLQRIGKTLSILGFDYHLLLQESVRDLKIVEKIVAFCDKEGVVLQREKEEGSSFLYFLGQDALGREWPLFSVQLEKKGVKIFTSLERLFALSLEKEKIRMRKRDIENQ